MKPGNPQHLDGLGCGARWSLSCPLRPTPHASRSSGLTLVECMLSVVILATLIVMAMGTFGTLVKSRKTTTSRFLAIALANQMISEILPNAYQDPSAQAVFGPEPGETAGTRAAFNDVDDYHNWADSPPALKDGTAVTGFTGWTRQVAIEYLDPDTMSVSGTDTGLKRITVTVRDPQGISTSVAALRSRSGAYDQKPSQPITCVEWVGVELQLGNDAGARMASGTNVLGRASAGGP